jgi:integrase
MEVIRWFPLDRVHELEREIALELQAHRRARRRDAIGVALGLHGLRVGEVRRAECRHFFAAARSLDVFTIKKGDARKIPLHDSLVAAMQRELADRGVQSRYLLASRLGGPVAKRQMQALATRLFDRLLGPQHGLTFHSLRHTFAMRLYAETRDLFLVKRMLGHRSVKNTEVYARSLAEVPAACLVRVGDAVVVRSPEHWPGAQLRLFDDGHD